MPILETAPGVEEVVEGHTPTQEDVALSPLHRDLGRELSNVVTSPSVREAIKTGSMEQLEDSIVRETIGYLSEPYFPEGMLAGTVDISGRPTYGFGFGVNDLDPSTRMREVSFARRLSIYAPPAKQAVRLHRCYVIGPGIPKPVALDSDVQAVIDDFWDDPDNYEFCTHIGQAETDARQLIDGELFVAFYTAREDGHVKVRTVDPLDVDDIICHPEDRKRPLYYRVRLHHESYDFHGGRGQVDVSANDFAYMPDWRNTDPARDPYRSKAKPRAPDHACMAHWPLNRMGQRGVPDFCAGSVWIAQHKKFMENRAILQDALSKIALVKTVKGGPGQVGSSAALDKSSLTATLTTWERNPAAAPGATFVKNPGVDLEQLRVDTGAGNAVQDGEQLAQMVGTAFGLPTHYIMMSTEASRLATAVAMELPVLKMYEDAQRRWLDMLRSIMDYLLLQAAKYGVLYVPVLHKHGRELIDWENAPPAPSKTDPDQEQTEEQQQLAQQNAQAAPQPPQQPAAPPTPMPPPQAMPVREQAGYDPLQVTSSVEQMRQRDATNKQENKERGQYRIDMPPILQRETQSVIGSVVQAVQSGLLTPEQGAYLTMNALAMDDVSDAMVQWREWLATHARHIQDQSEQILAQQQQQTQLQQQDQQAQQAQAAQAAGPAMGSQMPSPAPSAPPPPQPGIGSSTVPSGGMSRPPSATPNG